MMFEPSTCVHGVEEQEWCERCQGSECKMLLDSPLLSVSWMRRYRELWVYVGADEIGWLRGISIGRRGIKVWTPEGGG